MIFSASSNAKGATVNKNTFIIYTGDAKTMSLKALYSGSLDALDLTDCTEIDVSLPLAGGGFAHRLLSDSQVVKSSPATSGKFTVPIDAELSATLKIGELQGFDVTFTIGTDVKTVRYVAALTVFERSIDVVA